MSKRSKIENEPVELVDAEPIEAGDVTLDLQRNSEGALVIEEQLSLAMSTIIDAAESRKRVARTGARRYNATRRDRMLVLAMLWSGSSHDDIAAALGMTRETMRNHFAVELDMGTKGLVADLVKSLTAQAMAGNVQAIDRLLRRF